MKKLALILGSLLVVGTVTQAKEIIAVPTPIVVEDTTIVQPVVVEDVSVVAQNQPTLRVTNVGQYIEIDNNAGGTDGNVGTMMLGNKIGLATENWKFAVMARKSWDADTDSGFGTTGSRIDLDAWRNFSTEAGSTYALGARWRQEESSDSFYLRTKYSAGLYSGYADARYVANEGSQNAYKFETMPLNVTVGPVTMGYYFEGAYGVGSGTLANKGININTTEHQLRAYFPIFKEGNLTATGEYRFGLHKENKTKETEDYKFAQMNRLQVALDYQYTQNLSFSTYYLYQITKKENKAPTANKYKYYGEFGLGWNYAF
ncbi:OmpG family monomeric porin [uncultured Cetobacterium sp.]|uniref:OmpG family monomeric porin n=1 Tax=uncultured Cetobacterium sp. TaxID=527638 RepID=UPI002625CC2C|nr:OmpG family monomeric porin [uncultured Cetobacterium sp.]